MKRALFLPFLLVFCIPLLAQIPQGISHQAVIRNTQGELVTGANIGLQVTILKGSAEGTAVYVEAHNITSNENALITYVIGDGTSSDNFEAIDWADGPYFLKTEADPEGGTDYSITGTTQFLSVPYALHTLTSADAFDGDMKQGRIINLGNPVSDQDGATKEYVDALLARIEALEALAGTTVTDIDGNVYRTVTIGAQMWMAENLRVTQYNNGDDIPTGLSNTEWGNTTDGAYAVYDHNASNTDGINSPEEMVAAYGNLYNFYAVADPRVICPIGWHVPGDDEWTQLTNYLINGYDEITNENVGSKLKSCRQVDYPLGGDCETNEHPRWDFHATYFGTDNFKFKGLPCGTRYGNGTFGLIGSYGTFWSSTLLPNSNAWYRFINSLSGTVGRNESENILGFSIRCVMDNDN